MSVVQKESQLVPSPSRSCSGQLMTSFVDDCTYSDLSTPTHSAAAKRTVEMAKSQLQWLADGLQRSFEAERDNPNPFSLQCAFPAAFSWLNPAMYGFRQTPTYVSASTVERISASSSSSLCANLDGRQWALAAGLGIPTWRSQYSTPRAAADVWCPPMWRRHVQLLQTLEEVERLPPGPAVVLASLPSMEAGPAKALLTRWATDERNLIVVPGRPLVRMLIYVDICTLRFRAWATNERAT